MNAFALYLLFAVCQYDPATVTFGLTGRHVNVRAEAILAIRAVEHSAAGVTCSQILLLGPKAIFVEGSPDSIQKRILAVTPKPKTRYVAPKQPQPERGAFWWERRRDSDILREGTRSFRPWP